MSDWGICRRVLDEDSRISAPDEYAERLKKCEVISYSSLRNGVALQITSDDTIYTVLFSTHEVGKIDLSKIRLGEV